MTWGTVPQELQARRVFPDRYQPAARPTGWEPWPPRRNDEWGGGETLMLADVLRGVPARRTPDGILLHTQFGVFAWDAPLIRWAYEAAMQRDIGTSFSFAG